jgi:hypothetical protein
MSAVEKFPILLSEAEEESSAVPPCFSHEGINVRVPYYLLERLYLITFIIVPLYPPQQSLPTRSYKTQHQCRRNTPLPTQDRRSLYRILQGAGRGEHKG